MTLRAVLNARPRLQREWKALASASAFHEAHLRAKLDKIERLRAFGAYEGRASNDNVPCRPGPVLSQGPAPPIEAWELAPAPNRSFYLLTVTIDGATDSDLAKGTLARLINAAILDAGLSPYRRIFTPGGGPAYLLFKLGGLEDRVAERIVEVARAVADKVTEADRRIANCRTTDQPLGPLSASIILGEATVGAAWTDGPVFARSRALTGTGPYPTLRLDPTVYRHAHRNGPMARALLAVFSVVAVGEGMGEVAYETVVGPRRAKPPKPSRARVAFLGGRFELTHGLRRRR